MGVVFLEHLGGKVTYNCWTCETHLTNKENLTRYGSGQASLFERVVNVCLGETRKIHNPVTGEHLLRNVFCKMCGTHIGWFYEYTVQDSERYKEGKISLDLRRIIVIREKIDF